MALFKVFKGLSGHLTPDLVPYRDGHTYFCTDDTKWWIDFETAEVGADGNPVLERKYINQALWEELKSHLPQMEENDILATQKWVTDGLQDRFNAINYELEGKFVVATFDASINSIVNLNNISASCIDWGDGTINNELSHTYANEGTYDCKIYGITVIDPNAFDSCSSLTSVIIGNSVTSIGYGAFYNCSGLTSVVIGNSVTNIGLGAFNGCSSLTSVVIPDSVISIGAQAFRGCSGLEEITIPFVGMAAGKTASDTYQYPFGYIFGTNEYDGGTATIQYYYGSSTSSLASSTYYIPTSLKKVTVTGGNILYGAFYNCSNLTSVVIPDSVTSIGEAAFYGCSGLTSVVIGNSVTRIGSGAFYNTGYYNNEENWENGVLYIGKYLIKAKSSLSGSYTIREGTLTIANEAFVGCSGLTSVVIPASVTSIGEVAFYGCSGLIRIDIDSPTPPVLASSVFQGSSLVISVPLGKIDAYKTAWLNKVSQDILNNMIETEKVALKDLTNYSGSGVSINSTDAMTLSASNGVSIKGGEDSYVSISGGNNSLTVSTVGISLPGTVTCGSVSASSLGVSGSLGKSVSISVLRTRLGTLKNDRKIIRIAPLTSSGILNDYLTKGASPVLTINNNNVISSTFTSTDISGSTIGSHKYYLYISPTKAYLQCTFSYIEVGSTPTIGADDPITLNLTADNCVFYVL